MSRRPRVAVLGGDGRFKTEALAGCDVRLFLGHRYGGNGELRRLEKALRAGGIDQMVVLARWSGHSESTRALRLCRKLGIRAIIVP